MLTSHKDYYSLLDLDETASIQDIKRSYRRKAKYLHPDRNSNAGAAEQFIALSEAYQYLIQLKTRGIILPRRTSAKYTTENLIKQRQKKAREQAERLAKMRYEEFVNSEYNVVGEALANVTEHLIILLSLLFLILMPIFFSIRNEGSGFALFILFIFSPLFVYLFRNYSSDGFKKLPESFRILSKNRKVNGTILTLCSCIVFMRIGFQTMIPILWLTFIFIAIPLIVYSTLKFRKYAKGPGYVAGCLTPFYLSLAFFVNYVFSFNPMHEEYTFNKTYQTIHSKYSGTATQQTSLIVLENNAYDDFFGIRVFADYKPIAVTSKINYTFKKGVFGVRVMTSYYFK